MQANTHQTLVWRARIIASSCGVTVVEDPSASTFAISRDGVLTVPLLSDAPEQIAILNKGGTLHEALHFSDSDFDALRALSPIERQFMMVFEDYRIERLGAERFKGAYQDLRDMWQTLYLLNKVSRHDPASEDVIFCLGVLCLSFCRSRLFDLDEAKQDLSEAMAWLSANVDADALVEIRQALDLVDAMVSTQDAIELARRVIRNFVHPDSLQDANSSFQAGSALESGGDGVEQEQEGPGETSDPSSQGAPADQSAGSSAGDLANQDASQPDANSSGTGEPDKRESAAAGAPDKSGPADKGGAQSNSVDAPAEPGSIQHKSPAVLAGVDRLLKSDGGELVAEAIEEYVEQRDRQSQVGVGVDGLLMTPLTPNQVERAEGILNTAMRDTSALRPGLQQLLRAVSRDREVQAKSGRVDPRKFWRLKMGDLRVFTRQVEAPTTKVHLHVMLDASESMKLNSRLEFGKRLMASIGLAAHGLNRVSCSWSAFQGTTAGGLHLLKRPNEGVHLGCGRLAALRPAGGTPLSSALKGLMPFLANEPSDRTILLLGTDGEPDSMTAARSAIRELRLRGIEVCVFGIQTSARSLDQEALLIKEPADMVPQLFAWLQQRLKQILLEAA